MSKRNAIMVILFAAIGSLGTTSTTTCGGPALQWNELAGMVYNEMVTTVSADRDSLNVGETVSLAATCDPGGRKIGSYTWYIDGQEVARHETSSRTDALTQTFQQAGQHEVEVRVFASASSASQAETYLNPTAVDAALTYVTVTAPKPTVQVAVNRSSINKGETVTATATASGGVPPYTYYWMGPDDYAWVQSGTTYTDAITTTGENAVYCIARDANGTDSESASASVTVAEAGQPDDGGSTYTSPAGTWSGSYGTMVLNVSGSSLSGTYTWRSGTLSGTLSGHTFTGTWHESEAPEGYDGGPCTFEFTEDWMDFSGSWSYSTAPGGGAWTGRRTVE